jgi:ectoine hydroxylase
MRLSDEQLARFDTDGFLRFENMFDPTEVSALKSELARVGAVDSDALIRERTGALRTVYRVHETDGPTASPVFRRLAQTPRFMGPVTQVLRDDDVYIFHSKCNIKTAIDGTVWLWHQDYGYWQHDGIPTPNMATYLVMLDEATELGGCLYFIPGSHKLGVQPAHRDETTTSYPQWAVEKERMRDILRTSPTPVAITGGPGTAVLFHCNLLHGSGHNLGANDRWHVYMAYNTVANKPNPIPANARPDYVVSTNYKPLVMESDDSLLPRSPVPA